MRLGNPLFGDDFTGVNNIGFRIDQLVTVRETTLKVTKINIGQCDTVDPTSMHIILSNNLL